MTTPVLYIEEVNEDNRIDWQSYIMYNGLDEYILYGSRSNSSESNYPNIKMTFLTRETLALFLKNVCCRMSSSINITMHCIDNYYLSDTYTGGELTFDEFRTMKDTSVLRYTELFGYDDYKPYTQKSIMDLLVMLRDIR